MLKRFFTPNIITGLGILLIGTIVSVSLIYLAKAGETKDWYPVACETGTLAFGFYYLTKKEDKGEK